MYRILLADDEALEREGMEWIITHMLQQPCEIIHAVNGRDAIQKASIYKPHIVFMDIRMPGLDGLEALKVIKTEHPQVKMVLVTAYEYFEYAKEAIGLGVSEYLIKPANRKIIVTLLNKLIDEIDSSQIEVELKQKTEQKLNQLVVLAKTELALGLISEQLSDEALHSLAELVEMPLSNCCSFIFTVPRLEQKETIAEEWMQACMEETIQLPLTFVLSHPINDHIACFVSQQEHVQGQEQNVEQRHQQTELLQSVHNISIGLQRKLKQVFNQPVFIGIGNVYHNIAGIRRSYYEAVFASTNVDEEHPICLFKQIEQRIAQPLLMGHQRDAVYVQKAIEKLRHERENQTFSTVDRATDYIHKNYNRELSLEETAEYVHLNPYYFSKVFKQQTGETFIDYLTKIRIKHAKQWMQQKEMSLKEICYLIGYNDPNYFSRVFKKVVGQTPTEYRASFRQS